MIGLEFLPRSMPDCDPGQKRNNPSPVGTKKKFKKPARLRNSTRTMIKSLNSNSAMLHRILEERKIQKLQHWCNASATVAYN